MQYIGGKQKSGGAQIAKVVNRLVKRLKLKTVSEPFCGGLSVTSRLDAGHVSASDACGALITLYRSMQQGWRPPDLLTREEWERLRSALDPSDPLTAFAGFGCSRSGNWFSAFIESNKRTGNHRVAAALAARESLDNKLSRCTRVSFRACDYREVLNPDLLYCDKPYANTMPYPAVAEPFDHEAFWAWARTMSASCPIAVSEQVAPPDFEPLLTFSLQSRLTTAAGAARRTEHLFIPSSQSSLWREALETHA